MPDVLYRREPAGVVSGDAGDGHVVKHCHGPLEVMPGGPHLDLPPPPPGVTRQN